MSKPFNLTDAKAGHPVQAADGLCATILSFNGRDKKYPLIGVHGREDYATRWKETGENEGSPGSRLVMAPIVQLDGKPVYPGDMISVRGCEPFPAPWGPHAPMVEWQAASWPRQYPTTRMTKAEFPAIWGTAKSSNDGLVAVANAAIAHGIEHGYLFDAAPLRKALPRSDGGTLTAEDIVANIKLAWSQNDAGVELLQKIGDAFGANIGDDHGKFPDLIEARMRAIANHFYSLGWHHSLLGVKQPVFTGLSDATYAAQITQVGSTSLFSEKPWKGVEPEQPVITPARLRAIMQAGMVNGWHKAYDQGGLRIDCPRPTDDQLDNLIAQVK